MADKEFPPTLRVNFIPDIENSGAKEGFIKLAKAGIYTDAKYNNLARIIFQSTDIGISNNGEPRVVPYSEYRKDPTKFPQIKMSKFGIIGLTRVVDADHGHEMTMFFSPSKPPEKLLGWFADAVGREFAKLGLTEETVREHIFEIGKRKGRGTQPSWYVKYVGKVDDEKLMKDPLGAASTARKESLFEAQAPAPAAPEIQNFNLNKSEEFIMEQINQLVVTRNIEVNVDRLQTTFEKGFGEHSTTPARAAYIATHAKELGYRGVVS